MTDQPQPSFLITTEDTLTEAEFEQLRADVQIAPRPEPPDIAAGTLVRDTFAALADKFDELLASRIACLGCAGEAHKAATAGAEPPPINLANVIVGGNGQCWAHVQFVDRPLAPGERPSGILIPGQVA